jgi:type II protein arginine methyltransferase
VTETLVPRPRRRGRRAAASPADLVAADEAIRARVPRWHFEMLNDRERNEALEAAISRVVRPGDLVLDIGTGAGLLALLAARHGAERVVSCEGVEPVADVAERVAARNGFEDRISIVRKWSTDVAVGAELPRPADVLVTEVIDCGLVGEGIVDTIRHAREHLLAPDATIVPARATVYAQLVESRRLERLNRVRHVAGFDLSDFNRLASVAYFPIRLAQIPYIPLAAPVEALRFDFQEGELPDERTSVTATALADGMCHAVVLWFRVELVPGIVLSNEPANLHSHWEQAVQCLASPVSVRAGRQLELSLWQRGRHLLVQHVR